jgi:presenilin 1
MLCCAVLRCGALQDSDSAGQKLGGALLNAIIFMAVIGGMTFVLFLLFKWGVS